MTCSFTIRAYSHIYMCRGRKEEKKEGEQSRVKEGIGNIFHVPPISRDDYRISTSRRTLN
jgi:hypothetical protein